MNLLSMISGWDRAAATLAGISIICSGPLLGQWVKEESGTRQRLRAVHAVSEKVIWASGNGGTVCLSTDGGAHWRSSVVPGADTLDFRDVHAVDAQTAWLLSIGFGESARIYKTTDAGKSWNLQFRNNNAGAFFDAFAFWDADNGIAVSDPVAGTFLLIKTTDGGLHWEQIPKQALPPALSGEGAFAASGTCITVEGKSNVWIGTGGVSGSRVFRSTDAGRSWSVADAPLKAGAASAGIFSVGFRDSVHGVVVGGDYVRLTDSLGNIAVTKDGGVTWAAVKTSMPSGFRSCVVFVPGISASTLIAAGPSGSDYSLDGGLTWSKIDTLGLHAISFAGPRSAGWGVGENGRIVKFVGPVPDVPSIQKR